MTAPLAGKRVVVTRSEKDDGPLATALRRAGAEPLVVPLIGIAPVAADSTQPAVVIADFDWIVFTSANGVRMFAAQLDSDARNALRSHRRIASVGPATARAVAESGGNSALIAPEFIAESLANALGDVSGHRILWPRAAGARSVLSDTLRARGAEIVERILYDTIPLPVSGSMRLAVTAADAVTFTSPSAVRAFVTEFGTETTARIVCIGPVTALAAREAGLAVHGVAPMFTLEGLVAALTELPAAPVDTRVLSLTSRGR